MAPRAPLSCDDACRDVRETTGVDFSLARARAGFARGHLLDVVLHVPGGKGDDRECEAAERLVARGIQPDVFLSSNLEGGDEANVRLLHQELPR